MTSDFTDLLPLSRSTLDRDAAGRDRPDVLATAWDDPATRVVVLAERKALAEGGVVPRRLRYSPPAALPEPDLVLYLGRAVDDEPDLSAGAVVLGAVYADAAPFGEAAWADLRLDGADLSARDAGVFAELLGLANWHRAAGFSPRSGAATRPARGGWVRHPEGHPHERTGEHVFPRTDAAVIMGVVDDADRLLLASNANWPENRFSVLAGFVEPGESFEAAVRREVQEESGIRVGECRYLGSQPWPFPASVMVGFLARTAPGADTALQPDGAEIREARWFTRDELLAESGTSLLLPGRTSIARSIIEHWYGGRLEGDW